MLDGTIQADNQKKYLKIILTQTEHLTNLTQNILLLTQMENNIVKLEKNNFDIHHLLKKVLIQFEKNIVDKSIVISLITDNDSLMVNADLNQIQRVIYNIIDNAIKFSRVGDELTIETMVMENNIQISISDTGMGMSETEIKYMWIRFHKGDKSRGQDKRGFGIGLSIVREIINAHNQTIDVFSQLGKGTTFIFTLDKAK
jgi:signal transduction histidine kinase